MNTAVAIRRAEHADIAAVRRVAERDCTLPPEGVALVAERDGVVVAWVEVASERVGADPFRHTADVVELLEVRARQLRESPRRIRRWNSAISTRSSTAMLSSAPCMPSK